MQNRQDAQLLRMFFGEQGRHQGKPLYEAIVLTAGEAGMMGGRNSG
jgi:uncharacterized protein